MNNTISFMSGFDKYDYDNWFYKRHEFIDSKTNQKFYTSQHEYHTLKKQHISDYDYDVLENPYSKNINKNNNASYSSYILNGLAKLKIY